jgi:hypothetical protein
LFYNILIAEAGLARKETFFILNEKGEDEIYS